MKLTLGKRVASVAEETFRVFHDVALVHQRDRGLVIVDGVLNRFAHEALRAFDRYWLDPDTRGVREPDLLDTEFVLKKSNQPFRFFIIVLIFNTRINIFRIFSEDHHVGFFWLLQRRRHPLEILHRAQTDVEVEFLTQCDVQAADSATDWRGQRALDGHYIFAQHLQRLGRQPDIRTVDLGRFFACVDFHPVDLASPSVSFCNRRVDHLEHHRSDVESRAIALNIRNDRIMGNMQRKIRIDRNFGTICRDLDMFVHAGSNRGLMRLG